MADEVRHPIGELQDAVDGRLDAVRQAAIDSHVAGCDRCRREIEALRLVKLQLAAIRSASDIPVDLSARLRRALDEDDRRTGAGRSVWPARPALGWLALAAAIVVVVWAAAQLRSRPIPEQVAADLRAFASSTLPLALNTSEPSALEAHLRRSSLPFDARVFDFGMMNYRLIGGGVHQVADRATALFAYVGPAGRAVICQMYEGTTAILPPARERRIDNGIEFLIYRHGEVTVVFWQEGALVCVLASNDDSEAAIRLAFAKAIRV